MKKQEHPWGAFTLCWLTGLSAGLVANLMALFVVPVVSTLLEQPDKLLISQIGSWIQSAFLIGWAVGGITIGYASDKIGRPRAMGFALVLLSLFSGLAALSHHLSHFILFRFMAGLGVGGAMVNISLLVSERWPASSRTIAVGSLLTSYQAGVFASGTVAYLFPFWRHAFAISAVPLLLAVVLFLTLKEKKKKEIDTVAKMAAEKTPLRLLILGGTLFGSLLIAYWASLSWIPTWIQELSATGLEKSQATMWHGTAAIMGCIAAGHLVNRWGRIRLLLVCFTLAFVTTVGMVWSHETFSSTIYVEFALVGVSVGMAQAVLYIYLPELFPGKSRGRDVGFCLNAGRFATVAAVLSGGILIPLLGGYGQGIAFFASAYLAAAFAALCCQETADYFHNST